MRYMLDTNICIYLMKHHPPQVAARFKDLRSGDVAISVITWAELRHGVERCSPADRIATSQSLTQLRMRVPVLPLNEDAANSYGVLAAAAPDRRRDVLDRLIAAHAVSLGLTLVTNNEADFAGYPGLVIENWV